MRVVAFDSVWPQDLRPLLRPDVELESVRRDDAGASDAALADAEVLISVVFDRRMAGLAGKLKLLVCPAAGTEHIDRDAIPSGVRMVNGLGHETAIAEHVFGALVSLRRRFQAVDAALRRGEWIAGFHAPESLTTELAGSNLGLLGFGRIGQAIARRAHAFEMSCAALTMHPDKQSAAAPTLAWTGHLGDPGDVDRLLAWADAVVLCCELSAHTRGLVDARRFGLMRPSALLVNVARGPIAVESDLFDALRDRRIAGAALDVWYRYPHRRDERTAPSRFPFHELDNVLMTPHSSGWTTGNKQRRLHWMAGLINDLAAGVTPAR